MGQGSLTYDRSSYKAKGMKSVNQRLVINKKNVDEEIVKGEDYTNDGFVALLKLFYVGCWVYRS